MKIFCIELNKEFPSKTEMFLALKKNSDRIIGLKKAAIKESDGVGYAFRESKENACKAVAEDVLLKAAEGDTIYAIINTTNWLDSHGDVHLDGIWDKSINEQQGKVYYAVNHELKLGSIISYPDEVTMSVPTLNWKDLGIDHSGTTQALLFAAQLTDASNKSALKAIKAKKPLENSVRMQYVDMVLCIDSNEKGLEQERMNFYQYLPKIANKETAIEQGYYWGIKQAKIVKEGSAVLAGSNSQTPILYSDPSKSQSEKEQQSPPEGNVAKLKSIHLLT